MSKTFYHGTSAAAWADIQAHGLIPHAGKGGDAWAKAQDSWTANGVEEADELMPNRKRSIFVTTREDVAAMFAAMAGMVTNSTGLVLKVALPDDAALHEDEASNTDDNFMGAYRYCEVIPPDAIQATHSRKVKCFADAMAAQNFDARTMLGFDQ